jgi:hypothetical protein
MNSLKRLLAWARSAMDHYRDPCYIDPEGPPYFDREGLVIIAVCSTIMLTFFLWAL